MLLFTDGACIRNGKPDAMASFAVYAGGKLIRGKVMPYEYEYCGILKNTYIKVNPSNNRGELLAIVHGLLYIITTGELECVLYSDSLICINTINEWYYKREQKGTLHEFKNLDLINIVMSLIQKIKISGIILKCIHTRAHQKWQPAIFTEHEKIVWKGNDIVDKYATSLLSASPMIEYEELTL